MQPNAVSDTWDASSVSETLDGGIRYITLSLSVLISLSLSLSRPSPSPSLSVFPRPSLPLKHHTPHQEYTLAHVKSLYDISGSDPQTSVVL